MYSTLEKYTFDHRKTVGGEPVIERFGLTRNRKKKNTRSNSRKDSRNKKRSRSQSKRKSRSPRKKSDNGSQAKKPIPQKQQSQISNIQSSSEDAVAPANIQRVNVRVDSGVNDDSDGYGYGCGNGYCDDGYLGPGGFIYRYPPPWNYMDSINPGFYYPEPTQYILPYQSNNCGDLPDVARGSVPITNSIKVFSDNKQSPVLDEDASQKNASGTKISVSEYPVRDKPSSEEYVEKIPLRERSEQEDKPRIEQSVHPGCGKDDTDHQSRVEEDKEKFPSEPVDCGSNSTVITTLIVLGIIVLIAIVLAFIFVKRSRRN